MEIEDMMVWRVYESSIRGKVEEQLNELEELGYEIKNITHTTELEGADKVWIFARLRDDILRQRGDA